MRLFFITLLCLATLPTIANASTYDFESLTPGTLGGSDTIGQDNWYGRASVGVGTVATGSGVDSTQVVQTAASEAAFVLRQNDANFSFPALTTPTATYQFDVSAADFANTSVAVMGYSVDASFNNTPAFGLFSGGFGIQPDSAPYTWSTAALPAEVQPSDWLTLQLQVDLSANGGQGSGSFFYKDLTQGDTSFTAVAGLQNINLEISFATPSTWDTLYYVGVSSGVLSADNFSITSNPVPEPSSFVLAGVALLGTLYYRRRRTR